MSGSVIRAELGAEVTEFLGRDRYARGERTRVGMRDGDGAITVKSSAGAIELKRHKVRGMLGKFAPRLLGKHVTRTRAPEPLVTFGGPVGLWHQDGSA